MAVWLDRERDEQSCLEPLFPDIAGDVYHRAAPRFRGWRACVA